MGKRGTVRERQGLTQPPLPLTPSLVASAVEHHGSTDPLIVLNVLAHHGIPKVQVTVFIGRRVAVGRAWGGDSAVGGVSALL